MGPVRRSEQKAPKQKVAAEVAKIPIDIFNEQVILAAGFVDAEARKKIVTMFQPDMFFGRGHAKLFEVLQLLAQKQLAYDPLTVQQLGGDDIDIGYLEQLIAERPAVPPNLAHHVKALRFDHVRIEAARGPISQLLESIKDPSTSPMVLQAQARGIVSAFESGSLEYLRDPDHLVQSVFKQYERRRDGQAIYPMLDDEHHFDVYGPGEDNAGEPRVMPGAAPKEVSMLTGVPGSGKSTALSSIVKAQAKRKRKVLYGAWEMGSEISLELCASISLGLSRTKVMRGMLSKEEEALFRAEVEELAQWVRFFELPFGRKQGEKQLNDRNLDLIHGYIVSSGCEVFVADLWRRAIRQFDPDEEEEALYRQQAIAKETNTHCLLVHQQRLKDIEGRADKRPTREGLKGSGAWTEVADLIMGTHNEALWKTMPNDTMELLILKQRFGRWPLAVEFDYDPEVGALVRGRSKDFQHPGEEGQLDAFISSNDRKGGRRGRKKF